MADGRESESSYSGVECNEGDTDKWYSGDDCESNERSEGKSECELESSEESHRRKDSRPKKRSASTANIGSGKRTKPTVSSSLKEDEVEKLTSWIFSTEQATWVEESIYFLPLNLSFPIPVCPPCFS